MWVVAEVVDWAGISGRTEEDYWECCMEVISYLE